MRNISLKTAALVLSTLCTIMQVSAADTGFAQNADLSIAQLQGEAYITDCVLEDNLIISSTFGANYEISADESDTVDFVAEDNLLTSYMLGSVDLLNEDTETEMIAEESSTIDFVAEESLLANYMYGSVNSEDLAEIEDDFLAMN